MPRLQKFCACGCGQLVRAGNRYVKYHHRKGKSNGGWSHTEEWKAAKSKHMKGNQHAFGYRHTDDARKAISTAHKGRFVSVETRCKMSIAQMGNKKGLGIKHTEATKRRMSEAGKKAWAADTERRVKQSETQRNLWRDPVHRMEQQSKMVRGATRSSPNKPETKLLNLLESIQPGNWKYIGDGSVRFDGKNPDFMHIKDKCLLVELFGDYWHRNDSPQKRAAIFKPFGFRTLVVWEHELKNQTALVRKINRFVNH